jgi:hypothetical protein
MGNTGSSATLSKESLRYQQPTGKQCSVFISHAGPTMLTLADQMKSVLEHRLPVLKGTVFLDEWTLRPKDSGMDVVYESARDAFVGTAPASAAHSMLPGQPLLAG